MNLFEIVKARRCRVSEARRDWRKARDSHVTLCRPPRTSRLTIERIRITGRRNDKIYSMWTGSSIRNCHEYMDSPQIFDNMTLLMTRRMFDDTSLSCSGISRS